jgi:hypothetical protein
MTRTTDACIYNDQDLYKNLLTDFLAFNGEKEDDEKIFKYNLDKQQVEFER